MPGYFSLRRSGFNPTTQRWCAMCRVEGRTVKTTFDIMRLLDGVFSTPQMEPLRRTIGVWFKLLLRRKVPKASVPFFQEMQVLPREAITPG